jgi:ribosomal protein L11 methyltransferase
MKKFFSYKIYTQPFNVELLSGILWDFDITGLLEDDDHVTIFISEKSITTENHFTDSLKKLKYEMLIDSFSIKKELLEDKNWNELWEKSREVIRVSERIIIKPSFIKYDANKNEIVITIDPKMSFGTGEHQSTKLVLRLLEKYIREEMKVLDVGSGTGILSIAAIKLGASNSVAVDYDETCFENCKENVTINNVENEIEIVTGEIDSVKENNFDIIVANIQKSVLIEIAEKIKMKTHQNGIVILAGLLNEDETAVHNIYSKLGYKRIDKLSQDEWIALVFQTW